MKIEGPKMPMRDYLGLVKCDLLTWRLVLTVATEYARVPELVDIATLKNLVALEFISPPQLQAAEEDTGVSTTTLNDRIIRTWSEIAKSSNAFKHLSVMRLYHQRDLSRVALRYLQDLPSLGFIIAHNCQGLTSAFSKDGPKAEGWEIVDIPEILEATRLYSCYTAMMDLDQEGGAASHHDIPFLDFQVGKSTHRANKSIRRITQPVCLRRCADPDTPEPIAKKPKLERGKRPQVKGNTPKKALMKYRKGKDLGDLLEEFM